MKNKKPLFIVLGVVLLGAVAFYFMKQKGLGPLSSLSGNPADVFSNALTGSGSVSCEYTDAQGQIVKAYVKNGKIRTDMTGGTQGNMSFIMRDKTMYSWKQGTNEGFAYKIPEVTGTQDQSDVQITPGQTGTDDIKANIEQYKESCVNGSVDDSMFELPTDVNFTDYSTMMQDATKQIPADYKQYIPQQ